MKKYTIGFFMDSYFPMLDGVTMDIDNLARRLNKYFNIIVFVPVMDKNFDDSKLPYKVVRCKSIKVPFLDYRLPLPNLDKKFKKELCNSNIDLVHVHSPITIGKIGIKYGKRNKVPIIATMHSQFKQDIKRAVKLDLLTNIICYFSIKKFFDKCDQCYAVNDEISRIFYEEYKCKEKPLVLNNATEMKPVKDKKEAEKYIKEKYNINDEKIFLFVGRLNIMKNILFTVDSLNYITNKYKDFKYKMLFVGTGQDEEALKERIRKYNLEDKIVLCGKVTDREELAKYYSAADLFLFPSLYDASSIVQIEAASQSTPSLFLEGAATTATITNNVNGYIEKNNYKKYGDRIIKIFEDKDLYNKVCKNTLKDIYINWDDEILNIKDLYLDFINRKE